MNTLEMLKQAKETGDMFLCKSIKKPFNRFEYIRYDYMYKSYAWCDKNENFKGEELSINRGVIDWEWEVYDYEAKRIDRIKSVKIEIEDMNNDIFRLKCDNEAIKSKIDSRIIKILSLERELKELEG